VTKKGADVICMSWGIGEDALAEQERQLTSSQGTFRDAVWHASKTALVFAALDNDPDVRNGKYVPANFPGCFKISSYVLSTEKKIDSESHDDAFYFPAEGLELAEVPDTFKDSVTKLSGTSYATALAAGTAALLLVCVKVAYADQTLDRVQAKLLDYKKPEGKIRSIFKQWMKLSDKREHYNFVAPW
jgi:subtilisin family serine protease